MATALWLAGSLAAADTLGTVAAEGSFKLNNAAVRGNATLTEGALVETEQMPSRLDFTSGARVQLDPNSRVKVYADRIVVERGSGELTSANGYALEARTLRIAPVQAAGKAKFALASEKSVQVAATSGKFRVVNASGVLVSNLEPGLALEFEPQVTGPAAPSSFVGCLLKKDGKWILYEQTTRMIVELRGTGIPFEKEWGNRVQANGTARAAAQPNVQLLDVTSLTRVEQGGCSDVAAAIGAETPSGPVTTGGPKPQPPKGGGMSAGAKIAIIAAVAAGGGAAGVVVLGGKRSK